MKATKKGNVEITKKLAVDTIELKELLSCGRVCAENIGRAAGAEIRMGRRLLWNLAKVQKYLDEISGE